MNLTALLEMEWITAVAVWGYQNVPQATGEKEDQDLTPQFWSKALADYPELACHCSCWSEFAESAWTALLQKQPRFAERCSCWKCFDLATWRVLLRYQPQLRDHCPEQNHPVVLSGLIGSGKFTTAELDTSKFSLEDWFWAVKYNPDAWLNCPCKEDFTSVMCRSYDII